MRFALSAVAAASGLLLLGLALYGQPDAYLRLAREQWETLVDSAAPEPAQDQAPPSESTAAALAQLQQQVAQLREELMARQDDAEQARQALAAAQLQRQAAEPPAAAPPPPDTPRPSAPERSDAAAASVAEPERHDAAPTAVADQHEPPAAPERRTVAKPPVPAVRPAPRPEADTAESVLARLRQAAPAVAPEPPQQPERTNRGPSPSLRRLIAARAALASGQIEDARRMLQEAQLQLVFRPVGSTEDDPVPAGQAASDVAHALDALSGNDLALSRSYIDRAVDDASGRPADPAARQEAPSSTGYAPAYPLR